MIRKNNKYLILFTNSDNREFEEIGTVAFCITGSGEEVKTIE